MSYYELTKEFLILDEERKLWGWNCDNDENNEIAEIREINSLLDPTIAMFFIQSHCIFFTKSENKINVFDENDFLRDQIIDVQIKIIKNFFDDSRFKSEVKVELPSEIHRILINKVKKMELTIQIDTDRFNYLIVSYFHPHPNCVRISELKQTSDISEFSLNSDFTLLFVVLQDYSLVVWDLNSELKKYRFTNKFNFFAFSKSSTFLATNEGVFCLNKTFTNTCNVLGSFHILKTLENLSLMDENEIYQNCGLNKEIFYQTLNEGAYLSPNNGGNFGPRFTLFHYACLQNDENLLVNLFILCKAFHIDLTLAATIDIKGRTPLDLALEQNNPFICKILLSSFSESPIKYFPNFKVDILRKILILDPQLMTDAFKCRMLKIYQSDLRDFKSSNTENILMSKTDIHKFLKDPSDKIFKKKKDYFEMDSRFMRLSLKNCCLCYCIFFIIGALLVCFIYELKNYFPHKIRAKGEVYIIDIENLSSSNADNSLFLEELTQRVPYDSLFQNFFIQNMLDQKFIQSFIFMFYIFDLIFYCYLAIFYTTEAVYLIPDRSHPYSQNSQPSAVISIILLIVFCYLFICEILEFIRVKKKTYSLEGFWNFIDWILILLSIPALIFDLVDIFDEEGLGETTTKAFKIFLSLSLFFLYIRILSFARGFESSAFLLRIIEQVLIFYLN